MSLTPAELSLRGKIAVETSWSRTDNRPARTAAARKAFNDQFEKQVDPEGTLPPTERAKRAEHARKAFYLRLAFKSAQARRRRAEVREPLVVELDGGGDHVA
jgi:hypothetical protein